MIKAITFDFWQTLYQGQKIDYDERLRRLKFNVEQGNGITFTMEQFQAAVYVARDEWSRAWEEDHRTLNAAEWLAVLLDELKTTLPSDHLQRVRSDIEESIVRDAPTLVDGAPELLEELSSRYRLGIISDTGLTPGRMLRRIMETDEITGYFAHLTFSDELGTSKPHPDNFLTTLQALGAKPEEAVHIGDLLRTDVSGAQNVGMRGVQYVGIQEDEITSLTRAVTPDAVIGDHVELFDLLKKWNNASR